MTRSLCASALLASALLTSVAVLGAEQFATAEEARAMLDRAVAALKANEDAALKAFNDEKNKNFRDRDLFVFCFSLPDGNFTAYQSPLMVGTDVRELKLEKNSIGQRAYDVVASAGEGDVVSIDYSFPKPGSKQPAMKKRRITLGSARDAVGYGWPFNLPWSIAAQSRASSNCGGECQLFAVTSEGKMLVRRIARVS